jgi:hypothetical protein
LKITGFNNLKICYLQNHTKVAKCSDFTFRKATIIEIDMNNFEILPTVYRL